MTRSMHRTGLSGLSPTGPVALERADHAAMLRARCRLSTPDAIQVTTALERHAPAFLGNDTYLTRNTELNA